MDLCKEAASGGTTSRFAIRPAPADPVARSLPAPPPLPTITTTAADDERPKPSALPPGSPPSFASSQEAGLGGG